MAEATTTDRVQSDKQAVAWLGQASAAIRTELGKVIVGQEQVIDELLVVIFARRLAAALDLAWLEPVGSLAWPWYVPLGTTLAFGTGVALSFLPSREGG